MTMTDVFTHFNPGQMIGLVAVAGGLLCGIVSIVMVFWHEIRKAEIEAALKQDMLTRGMTADEIRTVIEAGTHHSRKNFRSQHVCKS
jgi:hypothetical protein